jgi:DNA recombination protein RmuC
LNPILTFGIGLALGIAVAWLRHRAQMTDAFERGRSSTDPERAALVERIGSRDAEIAKLDVALRDALHVAEDRDAINAGLQVSVARVTEKLEAERALAAEKLVVIETAREELTSAFSALSGRALQTNNQMFLDLAAQTLGRFQQDAKGDLELRQQAIQELVAPVKLSLDKLDGRIHDIERLREGAHQALTTQVRSLACDFVEQASVNGDDGRLRPDLVVRLPGGLNIVVDAKTPLSAYLEAAETDDDEVRRQHLVDHARQVRDHMTQLGRKSYQEQFDPTPDPVVLFLPGEMLFSAALQQDPQLIEFGVGEKVVLATPTTLITLLRTVAYGWTQEALARDSQEISELGRQIDVLEPVETVALSL